VVPGKVGTPTLPLPFKFFLSLVEALAPQAEYGIRPLQW
jgi:hypothetical protein